MSTDTLAKFEEFFSTDCKDQVFEILEKYPYERSLEIDYNNLELFSPDLADLLIEKPDETLHAAATAIKNIDPLAKDADINIRVENLTNLHPLAEMSADKIGTFVSVEGIIEKVEKIIPTLCIAAFECRACLRMHWIEQLGYKLLEPSYCDCGGRSFRLLEEDSAFEDSQRIIIKSQDTKRRLTVYLTDDLCSLDNYKIGEKFRFTGTLKAYKDNKMKFHQYFEVNHIEDLSNEYFEELIEADLSENNENEYGLRDSKEYNLWRKEVLLRDSGKCIICNTSKHLQAHHIFGYDKHSALRVESDNGVALCKWCHGKFHSHYGKDATPDKLIKFIIEEIRGR